MAKLDAYSNWLNQEAWLMLWDTNPKTYHEEQEVKTCSKKPLSVGDILQTGFQTNESGRVQGEIQYEILEVIDERPAAMKGMVYSTCRVQRKVVAA